MTWIRLSSVVTVTTDGIYCDCHNIDGVLTAGPLCRCWPQAHAIWQADAGRQLRMTTLVSDNLLLEVLVPVSSAATTSEFYMWTSRLFRPEKFLG